MGAHQYRITTEWTGDLGKGTADYRAYARDHVLAAEHKLGPIPGSSDPHFRGDRSRWNPEELFVASLSACHMLWLLHLCADSGIVITAYRDAAEGTMVESADGGGKFTDVLLRPVMTITDPSRIEDARRLHDAAHARCFLARSVNFPVRHAPEIRTA